MTSTHTRLLLRAAFLAVLLAVATHTRADPDLFGNIRFGGDVVAARSATLADPYSYTSSGVYMNHEWLFQAIAYLGFAAAGTGGLMAVKLGLLAAMLVAVWAALRASGVQPRDCDLLLALVVITTFPQTNQVRAQLCSLALFACVLLTLTIAPRRPALLTWLVPIMALWPNLHGGWIVAAGTLAVWSGMAILTRPFSRASWMMGGASIAALAATMLNPWGWHMWTFLYEKVNFGRADINDWQPVFRLGLAYGLLWLLVAAAAVAGVMTAMKRRAVDLQANAVILMFAVASFRVNRLLSFFALSAVMLLGREIAIWLEQRRAARGARVPPRLAAAAAVASAVAMIAGAVTVSARNVSCIRMEDATFAEPELTNIVRANHLQGRMLTWFDYGHYAIWYFTPSIKISMDPRREAMYSDEMIQRHLRFYFSPEDRRVELEVLKPDYIWLPSRLDVTSRLVADGWKVVFAGPQSTLLAANQPTLANPATLVSGAGAPRCFPGP